MFLKVSRSVVSWSFWANVMNEQRQINNLISWKFLFKKVILNSNSRKSVEHMAKINAHAHFVVFLSRRCQNVENVHETFINTKIPF